MKTTRLTFYIILSAFVSVVGCADGPPPSPLAGWKTDYNPTNQVIEKDYQNFIHNLPPNESGWNLGPVSWFEDGAGRHAVALVTEPEPRTFINYYLIYETNNVRIKTIKSRPWKEWHM